MTDDITAAVQSLMNDVATAMIAAGEAHSMSNCHGRYHVFVNIITIDRHGAAGLMVALGHEIGSDYIRISSSARGVKRVLLANPDCVDEIRRLAVRAAVASR